jgi:outer membrane protein assembly factor BamB
MNISKPIRLWPGVVAVALMWLLRYVVPYAAPDIALYGMLGGIALVLVVLIWWLFFSRAPWIERIGAIVLMVAAVALTRRLVHPSIAGGMMGMLLVIYAIPVLSLALVVGAAAGRRMSTGARRLTMAAAIVAGCGVFTVIRTAGLMGMGSEFHWRWTPTPEERLLAQGPAESASAAGAVTPPASATTPVQPPAAAAPAATDAGRVATSVGAAAEATPLPTLTPPEWPGFRGSERNNVIRGVRIDTDWTKAAPVEIWRRPIGPAWSSFAVQGNRIYTQEQRGEEEVVACYDLSTGAPVWKHRDAARFWESNAGAGPRGTPALAHGRVYTLGATGIVNALDARTGAVVWSRSAAKDTGAELPGWGFAGSPLVVDDIVIVSTAGSLSAYDAGSGELRWVADTEGIGYSSPQLATIDGITQVLLPNTSGLASLAPADGKVLWKHAWRSDGIVQPALIEGHDVLLGSGSGGEEVGMRRLSVTRGPDGWRVEERWTSKGLKPYFNDFVVHENRAFGFDGTILSCIDLADGTRKWKGGRYGQGQMIVLPDQDVLLVLSEEGELALVAAAPDRFTELARVRALDGKTWNHPVLVGDVLLVRNSEEMAAYRLTLVK